MSSPSTKPNENRCPECEAGELELVVCSRTFESDGRSIVVPGLMPYQCRACGAKVWPNAEAERARRALEILKRQQAA